MPEVQLHAGLVQPVERDLVDPHGRHAAGRHRLVHAGEVVVGRVHVGAVMAADGAALDGGSTGLPAVGPRGRRNTRRCRGRTGGGRCTRSSGPVMSGGSLAMSPRSGTDRSMSRWAMVVPRIRTRCSRPRTAACRDVLRVPDSRAVRLLLPGLHADVHVEVVHHTAMGAQLRRPGARRVRCSVSTRRGRRQGRPTAYWPGVAPGRLSSGTVPPPSIVAGSLPSQRRVVS